MRPKVTTVERVIARLASRAHGVVTRAELLAAGLTNAEIRQRVRTGALIRVYRGVYRVGHRAPSVEATYIAAVKAAGEGAALSGRAAAHLLGLLRGPAPPPEVTTSTRRRIPGLRTRRARRVEARTWSGIRVTTVPRTLIDLAAILDAEELARACHEARVKHGTRPEHVDAVAARHPNAPGAGKLRRVLHGDVHLILSKLEKRFLALLREDELPLPVTNRPAGGRYIDCRWPELRLTVELDSYTYHASRHAWERDRRRERQARARGDDFRRFTYGDVFDEPDMVLAELRPALTALGTAAPR